MAASMEERTHHRTFRPYKINVVCCHTRKNTDQRTFGCNSSHHYNVQRALRGNRHTTASTDYLRGRNSDMDLDKNQDSGNTTHTPKTHTREWTLRPTFRHCPSKKAGGDNMDRVPSSTIPSPNRATPLSYRLHGLSATSPL